MSLLASDSDVTVVVTACGRPDLLGRTLRSLFAALDQPVAAVIVVEDSGTPGVNATLQAQYPFIRYINNMRNFGQQASIDAAYAQVRTPYVLHCEDDWDFTPGLPWIARSRRILEANPRVSCVMLRGHGDPYAAGATLADGTVLVAETPAYPMALSWNPGLRRLADYTTVCPRGFAVRGGGGHEHGWAQVFWDAGFRMAHCFAEAVCVHSGDGRHVPDAHARMSSLRAAAVPSASSV